MKKIYLFPLLLFSIALQTCKKIPSPAVPDSSQITNSRDDITDLADQIAEDPEFRNIAENFIDLIALIDLDSAITDSIDAQQFFASLALCENVSQFDSLLNVYGFHNRTAIMAAVQSLNGAVDLLADGYDLESLSGIEQQALAALIWAIYFDSNDDSQSQTGAGCCDEYKAALKACTRSAFVYLAAMWLGVPILPDPLGVVQDAYACIRKADKDYKHCCNE